MKRFIFFFSFCTSAALFGQPYVDIVKFNYSYSPESGLGEKKNALRSNYFNTSLTLPIELKKGGDAFIINPFFDDYRGKVSERNFHVVSCGLLVGFLKKECLKNWDVLSALILRHNKQAQEEVDDLWQYGGIILTTWRKNQFASFKFGLYYNKEFFGNYFIPLVGIDWKINTKNNLFGVLPGSMIFEHQVKQKFYVGASFRALTNSYRLQTLDPCFSGNCSARNYLRIDDNQLGIFADKYLSKKIVLTAETGYTIFRKYRFGYKGENTHLRVDYKNDNFYCRATLAYRLRFR